MNCEDMMKMPQLKNVLDLRGGKDGLGHSIRWIYFADVLDCVKSGYQMNNYIHGGEFVVLTNKLLTDDTPKLISLISQMCLYDIAAIGINEGQISDELIKFCDNHSLPLFELPESFPLIDLSQELCKRLVIEENTKNSTEQLLSSIIDADNLNADNVYAQARFLNVDLSGAFCVAQFAFFKPSIQNNAVGETVRNIINTEFSYHLPHNILTLLQTGSVLALIPAAKLSVDEFNTILQTIVVRAKTQYNIDIIIGIGNEVTRLEEVRQSRNEASTSIKIANVSNNGEKIIYYKDQGIYALISHVSDVKFLDEFVEKTIGKLIQADMLNSGNLCETLENYLNHNCNAKYTAEAMYIHRNTLNYRLSKIWEILGRQCDDIDSCMTLRLAFMIRNIRRSST